MVGGSVAGKASGRAVANAQPSPRMHVAIITAMMGAIMFGIDCGNFGAVQGFESFQQDWCVGNYGDEVSCGPDEHLGAAANGRWLQGFVQWASMLLFVGAAAGSLALGPYITHNFGRRPCISIGAGFTTIGSLLTSYLSFGSITVFIFGRFVTGFGVGVCCFALPLYNSEVSTPLLRGATGSLFQLNVVLGQMLAAVITWMNHNWQLGMLLPGISGAVVMVAVWMTPESPRYVFAKDGFEAGVATLKQLRSGEYMDEAREISEQLHQESQAGSVSFIHMMKDSGLRRRVFIACWLQVAQQFTGFNALVMYSATLFVEMGFEDPFGVNMVFTAAQVVGIIGGLLLLDSSIGGRRAQLLVVTVIICPVMLIMGLAVMFSWNGMVELALIAFYALAWQHAWGMIPWVYPSELFSMAERDRSTSLAVFFQYASNAVLMVMLPELMARVGTVGMLFFFSAFNVLNLAFIVAFMKETKGVPLEEIPGLFSKRPASASVAKPSAVDPA